MDEEYYFVDSRNADPRIVRSTITPARTAVVLPLAAAPGAVVAPAATSRMGYAAAPTWGYPNQPFVQNGFWPGNPSVYMQPPGWGQPPFWNAISSMFGGINIGQLIDLVGQGFAALKALPAPPASTGDSGTDVANLVLYQKALAEHGKLDEQIRTGVHIVAKLLGA